VPPKIRAVRTTRAQIVQTAVLTGIILAVVVVLDYFINVVLAPGAIAYTPLTTVAIALAVTPAAIAYLILQNAKVQRALMALADERAARIAADGANAAKTQFLATMSHELRTPLNAIIGYAEIIEEDAAAAGAGRDDAQRIQRSAQHLLGLINSILDHVKLEAGELQLKEEMAPLKPIFDEVANAVEVMAAANGNAVVRVCEDGIGAACVDVLRLKQCMLNLASNAAKFTENGRITLRLRAAGPTHVAFEAQDTGIGMNAETVARLFQPFVQADSSITREYDGTGLGLVVTKQLVNSMGGTVSVTSTPGAGSTFTILLRRRIPLAAAA
jgi:signal transduction histidine kinase